MVESMETLGSTALQKISHTQPAAWVAAPLQLSSHTRTASKYLFSLISNSSADSNIECPLPTLLTENFDAEQIWQQIDLQAQPLLSSLKRRLKNLHKTSHLLFDGKSSEGQENPNAATVDVDMEHDDGIKAESEEDVDWDEPSQSEEEEEEDKEEEGKAGGVEDRFLKISDLERFLEEAEHQNLESLKADDADEEGDEDDGDNEEDEDEDMYEEEIGDDFGKGGKHEKSAKHPMYEDFFGGKKTAKLKDSTTSHTESDDMDSDGDDVTDDEQDAKQPKEKTSTHERKMEKIRKKIEELEKANLETKSWTMQGEVTATKRPQNSALEVELEFDHNTRPAPVITEEVTSSLEDIIKRRIAEEHFDDVQRKPPLVSTAPKKQIELDENKSEKGLAEIYEGDYMQKTGLAAAPTSSSDALKKEAALLFKKLCVKLDALSHFQFTPKPVIEDMSIQANVPALVMEEVASVAVSEASMLAPEELFAGQGDIKEEGEMTREDRKRLRAKKKRKFKASKANKEIEKKMQVHIKSGDEEQGNRESKRKDQKRARTHYGKSSKVFADLDIIKDKAGLKLSQKTSDAPNPSFLKL